MKRFRGPDLETETRQVTTDLRLDQVDALAIVGRHQQRSRVFLIREAVDFFLRENSTVADIINASTADRKAA